jgi:hypothetical protein
VSPRGWLASCASSANARNLAHMMLGCCRRRKAPWANPQSAPAITRSRPNTLAKVMIRSATISGCSASVVVWAITPGARIFPSGSSTPSQPCYSYARRGLAASTGWACAFTRDRRSTAGSAPRGACRRICVRDRATDVHHTSAGEGRGTPVFCSIATQTPLSLRADSTVQQLGVAAAWERQADAAERRKC